MPKALLDALAAAALLALTALDAECVTELREELTDEAAAPVTEAELEPELEPELVAEVVELLQEAAVGYSVCQILDVVFVEW